MTALAMVACNPTPSPRETDSTSSLEAGLLAHWTFESLDDIGADISGNGHDGSAEGTVACVPGRVGNALDVSGGNHFIRVSGDSDAFRFGPDDAWSMSGWLKASESSNGWQGVVTKSRDQGHWLGIWISGDARWHTGGGAGIDIGTVVPDRWFHWAVVHEAKENARGEIRLYVDGRLLQAAAGYQQHCGPGDLLIGKAQTPEGDEIFNGLIDEVRIYNRVLRASEIAELASGE